MYLTLTYEKWTVFRTVLNHALTYPETRIGVENMTVGFFYFYYIWLRISQDHKLRRA